MQTKGNSETHPLQSPNDEFADFGVAGWEYGNLTLEDKPLSTEMMPTNYLRSGLLQGLKYEKTLGVNPFKFGFIGGTDVHNSLSSIEENNFFGKHVNQEPNKARWSHVSKQGFGKDPLYLPLHGGWLRGGVGHREHTRSIVGRHAPQGSVCHFRYTHDGALVRRLELQGG